MMEWGFCLTRKKGILSREYYHHAGFGRNLYKKILSITGLSIEENGKQGEGVRFEIYIPKVLYQLQP